MTFQTRVLFQETTAAALFEVRFPRADVDEVEAALRSAVDGLSATATPLDLIRTNDHVIGLVKLARWARLEGRRRSADDLLREIEDRLKAYFEDHRSGERPALQAAGA